MNKNKMLFIGIGRAGNIVLNELLEKDPKYIGLFVNSDYGDMASLSKFNVDTNAYLFPAISGSGRDRLVAKEFLKDNIQGLVDTIARYIIQDVLTIFFSLDGGTGSGTIVPLCKLIRKITPHKKINLVGIIPDFNKADKISLENTLSCWNEIAQLSKNAIVDDIKFVDNSKRNTLKAINRDLVEALNNAYNMNGECEDGTIDDRDAKRVNTAQGYGLILNLDNDYRDVKKAIDKALQTTVFAIPNKYVCDFLAVSLKDFPVMEAVEEFEVLDTSYKAHNNEHNTIVLGGCPEPSEVIEMIKAQYDDAKIKTNNRDKAERTIIDFDSTNKKPDKVEIKKSFTSKEIESLMEGIFD